jgi:hypothetical protein
VSGRRRRRRRRAVAGTGTLAALLLVAGLVWPQLDLPGTPVVDVADVPDQPGPDGDADDPAPEADPQPEPEPEPTPTEPAPEPTPTEPAPEPTGEPTEAGTAPPVDDEASTSDRVQAPDGPADLVVTDVRVGVHDGFDRVVVDLAGEGTPGWFTELGDVAFEDGSGTVVDVDGSAVLTLMLNAVAFPPELPDPDLRWDGDRVTAPDAVVLTEVVDSVVFEGQHQLFIGLTERVPYRIARLDDPHRIVIDLLHP